MTVKPGRDPVLGGGAAAVGLPGPRRIARGPGEGRAAPVVLPQLLRGAGVRQGAPGVPGLPGRRGAPPASQGPAGAVRGRPLGGHGAGSDVPARDPGDRPAGLWRHRDRRRRDRGPPALQRPGTCRGPPGAVDWALGVGNPVRYARLQPGQVVLDVGSGGGIDTILAADGSDPPGPRDRPGRAGGDVRARPRATPPRPGSRAGPSSGGGRWRTSHCPTARSTWRSPMGC